ncbi:hypothetical protein EK21DRAFT_93025 [Setomelanomma holmii]|uniref:Uncharacterized protein n=1 Tax=Setomelanomma holmii TaxID=210430 RepID=A0A9P4H150_9PLEO|nr:hypothetical protein EK21DRAFT_93025 [Setomelanomma holmii]
MTQALEHIEFQRSIEARGGTWTPLTPDLRSQLQDIETRVRTLRLNSEHSRQNTRCTPISMPTRLAPSPNRTPNANNALHGEHIAHRIRSLGFNLPHRTQAARPAPISIRTRPSPNRIPSSANGLHSDDAMALTMDPYTPSNQARNSLNTSRPHNDDTSRTASSLRHVQREDKRSRARSPHSTGHGILGRIWRAVSEPRQARDPHGRLERLGDVDSDEGSDGRVRRRTLDEERGLRANPRGGLLNGPVW